MRVRGGSKMTVAAVLVCVMAVMVLEVEAKRYTVGGNKGWTTNVNYTIWAQDIHFYNGDWLFFVYDRHQTNVLEVNKTSYESCNSDNPLGNFTTGVGRDVVPLNETRDYYFISGKGFCWGGMKLALHVENPPPPPSAPAPAISASSRSIYGARNIFPAFFTIGVAFLWFW